MGLGYVKLHREAEDHPVFRDAWLWKLFCWCIMRANFRDAQVPRGSFTIGRNQAADFLGVSPSRVYEGWQRLKCMGCIDVVSNSRYTTITVCNYDTYNDLDDKRQQAGNSRATTKQQPGNSRATLLEEGKESKEGEEGNAWGICQDLLSAWNATPGVVQAKLITGKRQKHLGARLRDESWDWRAALAKFPLRLFASQPEGWQPNLDWFLRPDTVASILEGKYDWTKANGSSAHATTEWTPPKMAERFKP